MKRFKKGVERRLTSKASKIVRELRWNKAVTVLTGALTEAIWHEGGTHEDAVATAEIVYHAILRDLSVWFELEERARPAKIKVVPFKRKGSYFSGRRIKPTTSRGGRPP